MTRQQFFWAVAAMIATPFLSKKEEPKEKTIVIKYEVDQKQMIEALSRIQTTVEIVEI